MLQRLVDRASGSDAVTVFINTFTSGEAVPEHTHEVEEVLLVTAGECTVTVDGRPQAARTGDAVIIQPGTSHAVSHNSDELCEVIAVLASPRRADRRDQVTRLGHRPGQRAHRHPVAAYRACDVRQDLAVSGQESS